VGAAATAAEQILLLLASAVGTTIALNRFAIDLDNTQYISNEYRDKYKYSVGSQAAAGVVSNADLTRGLDTGCRAFSISVALNDASSMPLWLLLGAATAAGTWDKVHGAYYRGCGGHLAA
jgi:hypothetical protein